MISKRAFLTSAGALICVAVARPAPGQAPAIAMAQHEKFMRLAIDEARKNAVHPFGAVMVRPDTGEVMARGVNDSRANPTLHGEIACMNDYVQRHGNRGWAQLMLYSTGEPWPMCMSALVWAGIGGVVFASSIDAIRRAGIDQINITARTVIEQSPFYNGAQLGGVLATETDRMLLERKGG